MEHPKVGQNITARRKDQSRIFFNETSGVVTDTYENALTLQVTTPNGYKAEWRCYHNDWDYTVQDESHLVLKTGITAPYRAYTGVVLNEAACEEYNRYVDSCNAFIRYGYEVPEHMLNGLHNLLAALSSNLERR